MGYDNPLNEHTARPFTTSWRTASLRRREGLSTSPTWYCPQRKPTSCLKSFTAVEENTWCPHEAMYWPGTVEDIRRWIAECPQSHPKRARVREERQLTPFEVQGTIPALEHVSGALLKCTCSSSRVQSLWWAWTQWVNSEPLEAGGLGPSG
ncbi:hypothetical protein KUCAC02_035455 [Chaenocephalus aceratus]|nr:hypothetical protein KUCAC02_035455 [Chaenocephalus aceratus]